MSNNLELHQGHTAVSAREVGAHAAAAAVEGQIKGAMLLARQFPRDEVTATLRMTAATKRPGFAEAALYSFPRGGTTVSGPSVNLAREMARCWGNLDHRIEVVSMDADWVHVRGVCWDLETNARVSSDAKFKRLIQRKRSGQTQWVEPDERDLREMVNRHGAMCVRNAILQLMPPDVTEELQAMCKKTLSKAAAGDIDQDRDAVLRSLAAAFSAHHGVTPPMLEHYLGNALEAITAEQLADLRGVFTAIRDGQATRADYFEVAKPKGAAPTQQATDLEAKLASQPALDEGQKATAEAAQAKLLQARAQATAAEAAPAAEEPPPTAMEVRVVGSEWVGELPVLGSLAATLAAIDDEDAVIDMLGKDTRAGAEAMYEHRLREMGIEIGDSE